MGACTGVGIHTLLDCSHMGKMMWVVYPTLNACGLACAGALNTSRPDQRPRQGPHMAFLMQRLVDNGSCYHGSVA
jgi:hypothetical protein